MKNITIATFISNKEKKNNDFIEVIKFLEKSFELEVLVFCDFYMKDLPNNIIQIVTPGMTKYKRIERLISISKNDNILCIDNDITINKENLKKFINECISKEYAVAWGKIKAIPVKSFIAHLICIDKNLSHDYIRPILWKLNIGISLPGQIFMINKKYYIDKFPKYDTVYDDLTIGIITKKNSMPIYYTKEILGEELPKSTFINLLKQRKRWAKGFAESIYNNRKTNMLKYVIIHGFMYHLLWIPFYIILILLMLITPILPIIIICIVCVLLADKKIKDILWSFAYILVFPIVHIVWLIAFIKNMIKLIKN